MCCSCTESQIETRNNSWICAQRFSFPLWHLSRCDLWVSIWATLCLSLANNKVSSLSLSALTWVATKLILPCQKNLLLFPVTTFFPKTECKILQNTLSLSISKYLSSKLFRHNLLYHSELNKVKLYSNSKNSRLCMTHINLPDKSTSPKMDTDLTAARNQMMVTTPPVAAPWPVE